MLRRLLYLFLLLAFGAILAACAPASQPVGQPADLGFTGKMALTNQHMTLSTALYDLAVGAPDTQELTSVVTIECKALTSVPCPEQLASKTYDDITQIFSRTFAWQEGQDMRTVDISMPENKVVLVQWTTGFVNMGAAEFATVVADSATAGSTTLTVGQSGSFNSREYTFIITPLVLKDEGWYMDVKCISVAIACPEYSDLGPDHVELGTVLAPIDGGPQFLWLEEQYTDHGQATGHYQSFEINFSVTTEGIEVHWSDGVTQN